jgi:hypothetical protein
MDMDVPFAAVARNFDPDCNPGALRQAVDKLQKDLVKKGHDLPKLSMNWTDVRNFGPRALRQAVDKGPERGSWYKMRATLTLLDWIRGRHP